MINCKAQDNRGLAGLFLAGLVDRPDHQPAPPPAPRGFLQAGCRELADLPHRRQRVPRRAVQQPLRPVGAAVPGMLGDRPPVPLRHLADQRRHVLSGLLPGLRPRKARPQRAHQLSPFPDGPASPYPGSSSRLRFICPHKHMIVRRLRSRHTNPAASRLVKLPMAAAVLGSSAARSRAVPVQVLHIGGSSRRPYRWCDRLEHAGL